MKEWSKYQQAVFENIATGTGHTVVNAVAGSGKTTTIVEALKHVPSGARTLFVAFNKSIAENLKSQAPPGVEVSTLHSYGLRTITRGVGRMRINDKRVDGIVREMFGAERETWEFRRDLAKTVSLAKGTLAIDPEQIEELTDDFSIESAQTYDKFVEAVSDILLRCADLERDGQIDFDDMVWLPSALGLAQVQYDRVFVDEVQDLNKAQIEMVMRSIRPGGRICAVGDPRQAIYGFRGADSAAVDRVIARLEATVLPLSVCYRCDHLIVQEAREIVPQIEAAPGAAPGIVRYASKAELRRDAEYGDFVLSRTNAPLIALCLRFLRDGRSANIMGRDVGASLSAFVRKSKAKDVDALRSYVEDWRDKECTRLAERHRNTQAVEDRANCLLELSDGAPSVDDVLARIERLFSDRKSDDFIMLSTTHKAKGLERDRVWVLTGTYRRRPGAEEDNLYYVAVTRAKRELILVD